MDVDLQRIAREDRPLLIIALGDNAYLSARKIRQIPVVVLMAPNYRGGSGGHPALTGIELHLPPERYLTVFNAMGLKRVGIIGNPVKSGHYIRLIQQSAPRYGIEPIVREVSSPREVTDNLLRYGKRLTHSGCCPTTPQSPERLPMPTSCSPCNNRCRLWRFQVPICNPAQQWRLKYSGTILGARPVK